MRRRNLTKEDLQTQYLDLEKENFPLDKRIAFTADLAGSQEIAYHYALICKDWADDNRLHLENGFAQHGREGIDFLFGRLAQMNDEKIRIYTAFLIADILSKSRHRDFYVSFCSRLIPTLVSLLDTNDPVLRRKVIIAFGWVGSSKEIDYLTHCMLHDDDPLCRAWSAASLMQMSFHSVQQRVLQEKSPLFMRAITEEKDLYACGIMIEAVQTLFGKKWISSAAVETGAAGKIEQGKKSAVRFLRRYEA